MNTLDEEKLFYERFWALMGDSELREIFEEYGTSAFRRSSVLEGFEKFVVSSGFRGTTCVEIGTLKGLTALILSRHFKNVISVDVLDDPLKYEIRDRFKRNMRVTFINVKDNVEKAECISRMKFDAAYVDGDHTHDTQSDFDLVKRCGRVLFHEFWDAQPAVVDLLTKLGGIRSAGKFALWTR